MNRLPRREFLTTSTTMIAAGAIGSQVTPADHNDRATRVKIGQIGTGHAHASGKWSTARKLKDDFEVIGVVEPDPRRRQAAEKNRVYQGVRWLTEEELLSTPGLQAVLVETEVNELLATGQRCVDAGMHIHLDKPAGESLPAFRRLLKTADDRGLTVQMGYMYRHNPAFRFCFRAVAAGWLGKIFGVHGVMAKQSSIAERTRNLPYRGGMMFELGCHLIDPLVRVLGKAKSVTAFGRNLRSDLDRLPDNQLAVFEYPEAIATIRVSVTEIDGGRRRQFVVCGTEGTIEIRPLEPPSLSMVLKKPQGDYSAGRHQVNLPTMPGRYDDQLLALADVIRGRKEFEYSSEHDLAVQELILQASSI